MIDVDLVVHSIADPARVSSKHILYMKTGILLALLLSVSVPLSATNNQLLSWNNLGMHCMDSDYSVFSILPPYNTIEAQLIVNGKLVTNGANYTVTYQAVADGNGSINSTAMGKGNYFGNAQSLYGAVLGAEGGLAGWNMPGLSNTPQTMLFENSNQPAAGVFTPVNWWRAEGIPISPYDDAHNKNPYPLMRLIAKSGGASIATNDIVLPVSDEMDCRVCHASGAQEAARPASGWVWNGIQERDFRLNILKLHDEKEFAANPDLYAAAIAARGFNPQGLYRGVLADKKPVLCAACHASEALGAPSYGSIPPLTSSIHSFHAHVADPVTFLNLDNSANRSACYRCHPGSTTRCLRGAMGGAIAADGSMAMQCQSCHGNMTTVGSPNRVGWFMEPNCASCHSGTATSNNGQIRYSSVFADAKGTVRTPVNSIFSTQPNVPAPGISLFRFSSGHGGLQCEACHGSTHAEFPSTHANDNVRNVRLQGHAGVMVECTSCHASMTVSSSTSTNGPHGMHPVGQSWVSGHHDYIQGNLGKCQACHGTDNRGTVLSQAQADRTLTANFDGGTVTLGLFRGAMIGCYTCHNGPSNDSVNGSAAPVVANVFSNTVNDAYLELPILVTPSTAELRIISQPANGSLGVTNKLLTYFPTPGFVGVDTFTYAAWDGAKNSARGTGTVSVSQGNYSIDLAAHVPLSSPAGWPVAFGVVPIVTNSTNAVSFEWSFGDGSQSSSNSFPQHTYAAAGDYAWRVIAKLGVVTATNAGHITIAQGMTLGMSSLDHSTMSLIWPTGVPNIILEHSNSLDDSMHWSPVTNPPAIDAGNSRVNIPFTSGTRFYRIRQAW